MRSKTWATCGRPSDDKRRSGLERPLGALRAFGRAPWNLRRVVHLHRRAGFAASWSEIERDLAEGPEASITRLLEGKSRPPGAPEPEEFERISTVLGDAAIASSDAGRLKAWWFYRLLFSPDPLGERLTLMWHNHFATSNQKVNDPAAMQAPERPLPPAGPRAVRNAARIRGARPRPAGLARRAGQPQGTPQRKPGPRALGAVQPGHRPLLRRRRQGDRPALTGWNVVDGEAREAPSRHDDGAKTILGKSGKWRGSDVVRIILEQPATADRLAWRICDLLMGEASDQSRS